MRQQLSNTLHLNVKALSTTTFYLVGLQLYHIRLDETTGVNTLERFGGKIVIWSAIRLLKGGRGHSVTTFNLSVNTNAPPIHIQAWRSSLACIDKQAGVRRATPWLHWSSACLQATTQYRCNDQCKWLVVTRAAIIVSPTYQ